MAEKAQKTSLWVRFWILFGFLLASGGVVAGSYFAFYQVTDLADSLGRAAQPDVQSMALQEVVKAISEAESGVRLYTITQDEASLKSFYQAATKIDSRLDTLSRLSQDQVLMDSINYLVGEKFLVLSRIVEVIASAEGPSAFDKLYARLSEVAHDTVWESIREPVLVRPAPEIEDPAISLDNKASDEEEREQAEEESEPEKKKKKGNIFSRIFGSKKKREEVALPGDSLLADEQPSSSEPDTIWVEKKRPKVSVSNRRLRQLQNYAAYYEREETAQVQAQAEQILELTLEDQAIMNRLSAMFRLMESRQQAFALNRASNARSDVVWTSRVMALFSGLVILVFIGLLVIIFRDISRNLRLQARLRAEKARAEKLARAKEEFLSNMSHELRTPMNAVIGFTEQLAGTSLDEKQYAYLRTISRSADHLLALLNDVLDYSKLESGRFELEKSGFRPAEVLQDAYDTFEPSARAKGLTLGMLVSPALPEVLLGDPLRLKQMLFNLLSNAIKFTEHGRVDMLASVEERPEGGWLLRISVKDTGIGIPKDKQEKVFADFEQADSGTTRRFGGTGLGLSITRKLVELHGGKVWLESEPGKGTEIFLELPYEPGTESDLVDASPVGRSAKVGQLQGKRALVADDEPYNQELVRTILEKWGMKVTTVDNGAEALRQLEQQTFDCVLMDLHMPVLGGREAAREIRQRLGQEVPVVALTATSSPHEEQLSREAGMNGHLLKPFREADLYELLLDLLGLKRGPGEEKEQAPVTAGAIAEDERPYHLEKLSKMGGGDPAFLHKMLSLFVKTGSTYLSSLETGLADRDWEQVSMAAHKLVPACRHLGMGQLIDRLKAVEWAAQHAPEAKDLPVQVQVLIADLKAVVESVKKDLEELG